MFDHYLEFIGDPSTIGDSGYYEPNDERTPALFQIKHRVIDLLEDGVRRVPVETMTILVNPEDYNGQVEAEYNGKRYVVRRNYSSDNLLEELKLVEK